MVEARRDTTEARSTGHETRTQCLEAPCGVVVQVFAAVKEFVRTFAGGNFQTSFCQNCNPSVPSRTEGQRGPEVGAAVEKIDTLLCERQCWVFEEACGGTC